MSALSPAATTRRPRRPQVAWRSKGTSSATATPLVLINGFGAAAIGWPRTWVKQLAEQTRVITVDNRGGGWSRSANVPFTIADMAGDVIDVLDDAEIDRAVILGLSMGGMIAQQVAIDAPDRVAGLVLVGTRPPSPRFERPSLATALAFVRPVMPGESLHVYFRRLWSGAAAPGFADTHPAVIEELVEQTVELPTPRAMLVHQIRAMSAWGHAERLTQITAATIVVHGECDRFSAIANGEAIAELIPGARLERLAGIGHLVPCEAPDRLAELALDLCVVDRSATS
jgi:pimeloyl-ACP methyl ester carboxylesterase